jgi:hypothetical protein
VSRCSALLSIAICAVFAGGCSSSVESDVEFGWARLPIGYQYVSFVRQGDVLVHQGDMLLRPETVSISGDLVLQELSATSNASTWELGAVPYDFDGNVDRVAKSAIQRAITKMNDRDLGITLYAADGSESDRVRFHLIDEMVGYSYVGRVGGVQLIDLSSDYMRTVRADVSDMIYHEVLHAIGVIHEHCRPDRDDYVEVNYDNIKDEKEYAYDRYWSWTITYRTGYDFESVMHYAPGAFAVDPEVWTLRAKGTSRRLGGHEISTDDETGIAAQYPIAKPAVGCDVEQREAGCRNAVRTVRTGYWNWRGSWTCGDILADGSPPDGGSWGQSLLACKALAARCVQRTAKACAPPAPEPPRLPPRPDSPTYPLAPRVWSPPGSSSSPKPPRAPAPGSSPTPRAPATPASPPSAGGCSTTSSAGGSCFSFLWLLCVAGWIRRLYRR